METGAIRLADLESPFDLQATVESGQSFLWDRADGAMYDDLAGYGGDHWYETVVPPIPGVSDTQEVIRVRQRDGREQQGSDRQQSSDRERGGRLEWESTTDAVPLLTHLLRLDDDLNAILDSTPDEPVLQRAYDTYEGMRLVRDPAFPCLISFICSAQMRVSRIHAMQRRLAETYGDTVEVDGHEYHAFPRPEQLAGATESDLRDLKLGYRAPYVQRTAEMIATGEARVEDVRGMAYEAARESLTQFVGVGQKVADCVALFSLGYEQAVPLDTWIRTVIAEYFPDCDRDNYAETSRAIRERLGGEYAGYAQTYLFYYLRTRENTE